MLSFETTRPQVGSSVIAISTIGELTRKFMLDSVDGAERPVRPRKRASSEDSKPSSTGRRGNWSSLLDSQSRMPRFREEGGTPHPGDLTASGLYV